MQASVIGRRGLLLVLSSPSGAGKTAISRALLAQDRMLTMSVSATTRPMRPGEENGVDYDFIDDEAFARMVERDAFLEHADVFEYRYGTPREPVERALAAGRDMLFDVDWQGLQQLAQRPGDDLVSIFILPPSAGELERRLKARAQDSDEVVAGRMARAPGEISHWPEYDYVIVNTDLDESVASARAIIDAERLRRGRQTGLLDFVKRLVEPM
ncbi:MAG: guanylate kinase [Proteobacteria bacterium]|nr:guanylate kinase [Pseudomonadota bacterium]